MFERIFKGRVSTEHINCDIKGRTQFEGSSFLPSDNLNQLKQENGNTVDIFFLKTIDYKNKSYSIVSPSKDNEKDDFEIVKRFSQYDPQKPHKIIILENQKNPDGSTQYLRVEKRKILKPITKIFTQELCEKWEEQLQKAPHQILLKNDDPTPPISQVIKNL